MTTEHPRPGRGKTRLTPAQQAQLDLIRETEQAYQANLYKLKRQAKEWLENETRSLVDQREKAIYDGIRMGIPKRRIHMDGLETSSPNYVYDVEKRWDLRHAFLALEMPNNYDTRFSWTSVGVRFGQPLGTWAWIVDAENMDVTTVDGKGNEHPGIPVQITGSGAREIQMFPCPPEMVEWASANLESLPAELSLD